MSKYLRTIFLSIIISSLAVSAYCQEDQAAPSNSTPELAWMFGTVSQVSFIKEFISLITDHGYIYVSVPDNATIVFGARKMSLEDIKPEDSVRIQYYCPEPGKYVAVTVSESQGDRW